MTEQARSGLVVHMSKFYITTAIPYVNAAPHIGFALELVQTDAVARWRRQQGDEVRFLTGADENALKNVQAAEAAGKDVNVFVDENTEQFRKLARDLAISHDDFVRTTEERHFAGATKLWESCKEEDIYKKTYEGLYCVGCEVFYTEEELTEDGLCPEHKVKPELVEEENYFFKLSNYQDELLTLIKGGSYDVFPERWRKEVVSFIERGLEDFSISRSHIRAHGWGVPVPGDDSQVMYVWFDALANYITALDYGSEGDLYKDWWVNGDETVHVVGKGITRFHAIYWPAMLLSAGVPLPNKLFVHGYIHSGGEKMSKSLGNVIDPFEYIEKYGAEALRYFLLAEIPAHGDGDVTEERFVNIYNSALANDLGNLTNRVLNMTGRYLGGKVEEVAPHAKLDAVDTHMQEYRFDEVLKAIWEEVAWANKHIEDTKPWQMAKDESKSDELGEVLCVLVATLNEIATRLEPFLPETAAKLQELLGAETLAVPEEPLFPRIEVS